MLKPRGGTTHSSNQASVYDSNSIMYFPFRHDANSKETMLNSSGASSSVQGLHSVHGSYNMPTMPSSISSRNPVGSVHQASGSLQTARFGANNLPSSLAQISHGGLHGHSALGNRTGITAVGSSAYNSGLNGAGTAASGPLPGSGAVNNRATVPGLGVSPSMIGGAAPRITSSASSMISGTAGGGLSRAINTGTGLSIPSFSGSRLGSNVSGLGMQGPGRPSSIQQASPQMVSLLGGSFSNSLGSMAQGQVATGSGQMSSMGLMNDGTTSDGAAFDLNDFPQLTTRPSSGGSQGSIASLRKQVGVNPIVQQTQEFSIQNEDFPALPGFKGGNNDFTTELHQKDPQHENALALMQSQQYAIGRSAGFTLGGSFVPHRHQQQASQHQGAPTIPTSTTPGSFTGANTSDLLQLHSAADMYQAQAGAPPGVSSGHIPLSSLRSSGNPSLSSYEQLVQQYHQQNNPTQFRLGAHQQLNAVAQSSREQGPRSLAVDRFGLLGLLSVIRMSNPDLATLALGTDLTTLGLDLNARDNLYRRFASPWAEGPAKGEPEFTLPQCYVHEAPPLQPGYFTKFQQATLFYIFYSMPNDEAQIFAAIELYNRGWFYHKELRTWFAGVPNMDPLVTTATYERGSYYFFDANTREIGRKDHFVLQYEMMEKKPQLPQH